MRDIMYGAHHHQHAPCILIILTVFQTSTRAKDPNEAPLEAWWAEVQGIASGAIKVTAMLIHASGLPGAGVMSAVMVKVVEAAAGATENRGSCKRLAFLVRTCDIALADAGTEEKLLLSGQAEELLEELKQALEEAAEVAEEFGQKRGMVMRLVKYSGDADAFKQIHQRLDDCMKVRKCSRCLSRLFLIAFILFADLHFLPLCGPSGASLVPTGHVWSAHGPHRVGVVGIAATGGQE